MDGNEQVRFRLAGNFHPVAMVHVIVTVANEHGLHARFGVNARREGLTDNECDILLACFATPDSTRIAPTMSSIDRNDYLASSR